LENVTIVPDNLKARFPGIHLNKSNKIHSQRQESNTFNKKEYCFWGEERRGEDHKHFVGFVDWNLPKCCSL